MDLRWLVRNFGLAWRRRDSSADALRRLGWIYSDHLPRPFKKAVWLIGFRYPEPVGKLRLHLRSNGGSDGFIHGEVFDLNYYDLGLTTPPDTILDLGANIGLATIYFARRYPNASIAAVEPMPENLRLLRKNVALNRVPATVIAGAADVADGRVIMDTGHKDYGHRVLDDGGTPKGTVVEVAAFSIPTLLGRLGWDRIGLLKIDIEGHEKALLAQCDDWIGRVETMCIECHEGFGEAELADFARQSGFEPPEPLPGIWLLKR